ncbi:MAG: peptide-methionine (S)-S-oxide reductase MsrA [Pseudomonadota bacterium]
MKLTAKLTFGASLAVAGLFPAAVFAEETKQAYFAGGCFWCIEKDFESVAGVGDVVSGYQGGELQNPTYRNHSGHREVVQINYDPSVVTYEELLKVFFRSVDPTDAGGQFCDRGFAYTTGIYAETDAELAAAEAAKMEAGKTLGKDIATAIEPYSFFTQAEDYHQNYYQKNPIRYNIYRKSCGRNSRVEALWGDEAYVGTHTKEKTS